MLNSWWKWTSGCFFLIFHKVGVLRYEKKKQQQSFYVTSDKASRTHRKFRLLAHPIGPRRQTSPNGQRHTRRPRIGRSLNRRVAFLPVGYGGWLRTAGFCNRSGIENPRGIFHRRRLGGTRIHNFEDKRLFQITGWGLYGAFYRFGIIRVIRRGGVGV